MGPRIFIIHLIILASLFLFTESENFEKAFKANCLVLSKHCADSRIKREIEELKFVFRDVIYHYCLDLYQCTAGKRIVCHHVRRTEKEYVEKSQRKRVLKQCQAWNISVAFDNNPIPVPAHSRIRAKIRRGRDILKRHGD